MYEIKYSLDMFNSRSETTEERVSELADQLMEHRLGTKRKEKKQR